MPTFIKAGFWEKRTNPAQGFRGELNLDQLITGLVPSGPLEYNANATGIQPVLGTNNASGINSTIGGGVTNTASGGCSTIGGGCLNTASNPYATVSGGISNLASGYFSTIGGGQSNTSSGDCATVGGGVSNSASCFHSTIGGGNANKLINGLINANLIDDALTESTSAIAKYPDFFDLYITRARIEEIIGDYDAAKADYQAYLDKAPADSGLRNEAQDGLNRLSK